MSKKNYILLSKSHSDNDDDDDEEEEEEDECSNIEIEQQEDSEEDLTEEDYQENITTISLIDRTRNNDNHHHSISIFSNNNLPADNIQQQQLLFNTSVTNDWSHFIINNSSTNNNNSTNVNHFPFPYSNNSQNLYNNEQDNIYINSPPTRSNITIPSIEASMANIKLKGNDAIVIIQPGSKNISIGLSSQKFPHHLKSGEHNPQALYSGIGDGVDRRLQEYLGRRNNILSTLNGDAGATGDSYPTGEISGSQERYEKVKRMLMSMLMGEIFFSVMVATDILAINTIMAALLFVVVCDSCLLFCLSHDKLGIASFVIFFEGFTMLIMQLAINLPPLFTLIRLITFMVSLRARKEMLMERYYSLQL